MVRGCTCDAVVVGSGPNGLAAAIALAQGGLSVLVLEAEGTIGGGARSAELTLPGFVHDVCSAIYPLGIASPFFRTLPLERHGLKWIQPPVPLAHPFDDGSVALLQRRFDETGITLGADARNYRRLMEPYSVWWDKLLDDLLAPIHLPEHPLLMSRFARHAIRSGSGLAKSWFEGRAARAMFGGLAAHSFMPLEYPSTAAFGVVLALLAHAVGWPIVEGGSQQLVNALAAHLLSLGGKIQTGIRIKQFSDLPSARVVLFDLTPRQAIEIAGDRFPPFYRWRLKRFRYGPAAFKVDWALSSPIPWKAAECALASTVHLGGTLEEIAVSERAVWNGLAPEHPFVLLAQQSLFDSARAPAGKHTAWAYCHVPNGCEVDMTARIENQIERFAPGFRDCILARSSRSPAQFQQHNANYVGGDIVGGANFVSQLLTRPLLGVDPYATPAKGIYLCSASTPPGGGVHGMCGFHAAQSALKRLRQRR